MERMQPIPHIFILVAMPILKSSTMVVILKTTQKLPKILSMFLEEILATFISQVSIGQK